MNFSSSRLVKVMTSPIPNPISYWFQREFAPVMPRKWKRMWYIASIIAMTSFTDKPDFMLFQKINDLLKMTDQGKSYWIPKFMRNMVWKPILKECIPLDGCDVPATQLDQRQVTNRELEQICDYFLCKTPPWIVYAPPEYIRKDLKMCLAEIFDNRFNTQTAA